MLLFVWDGYEEVSVGRIRASGQTVAAQKWQPASCLLASRIGWPSVASSSLATLVPLCHPGALRRPRLHAAVLYASAACSTMCARALGVSAASCVQLS